MNTGALKTFAPAVRRQLMEAVTRKLDFALSAKTPDFLTTYAKQVAALRKLEQADRTGLIERVAYTWFNRLAALRFMDARGWHPFRARVLRRRTPMRPNQNCSSSRARQRCRRNSSRTPIPRGSMIFWMAKFPRRMRRAKFIAA